MKKSISTKDLVEKIEKLTKERISQKSVVSLDEFRHVKKQEAAPRILVIDDDDSTRAALKRILEADGYEPVLAADSSQLTKVLGDHPVDLIILDVGLPWINGFELAQMMKEHVDLKKIPLIFVSALKSDADVRRGFEVGASDYIKKPFDVNQIRKTVKTLLELSR